MGLLNSIKNIIFKEEEKNNSLLTERLEFRLSKQEKELYKSYAELREISLGKLIRTATLEYIDKTVQIND